MHHTLNGYEISGLGIRRWRNQVLTFPSVEIAVGFRVNFRVAVGKAVSLLPVAIARLRGVLFPKHNRARRIGDIGDGADIDNLKIQGDGLQTLFEKRRGLSKVAGNCCWFSSAYRMNRACPVGLGLSSDGGLLLLFQRLQLAGKGCGVARGGLQPLDFLAQFSEVAHLPLQRNHIVPQFQELG